MRRAHFRCRSLPVMVSVLAAVLGTCLSLAPLLTPPALAAEAAVPPLSVGAVRPLSLVDEEIQVAVSGRVPESLEGTRLVIRVKGPAEPSQVGQSAPELPEAGKIAVDLGGTPIMTVYTASGEATTAWATDLTGTGGSNPAPSAVPSVGSLSDLQAGVLQVEVVIPADLVAQPGAYLLVAEVKSGGAVIANGRVWLGRAAPRETPLDLAFVWPVSLGIHRDADGVFFDQVLEEAVSAAGDGGDLRGLLTLPERFPDWRFTVPLEPVLLTQLRDMADGYTGVDEAGSRVDVGPEAPPAQHAAEVMAAIKGSAANGAVEMLVGPYSGADLAVLAAEGWRDGLQQLQLGKQEIQQGLDLAVSLKGGYSPELGLTPASLSYYAQASIDYVVVSDALSSFLTEPIPDGADAIRARNADNDRLTLIFADSGLGARMTSPWDPGVLLAALAAKVAATNEDAIVITPDIGFSLVPAAYLDAVGRILKEVDWVRTQTLTDLLRTHGPDTRPVLLTTTATGSGGYIEESLLAGLRVAHGSVGDLVAIADPTRAPVEEVLRSLFMAQSRWWSRPDISPTEATIGMAYAEKARLMAEEEMSKVRFSDPQSATIMGSNGTVGLIVENDTGYALSVGLALEAAGVSLPDGRTLEVELAAGRTEIPVRVVGTGEPYQLRAALLAVGTTLDETGYTLRFVTIMTFLPWIIAAGVIVVAVLSLVVHRSMRRRRTVRAA